LKRRSSNPGTTAFRSGSLFVAGDGQEFVHDPPSVHVIQVLLKDPVVAFLDVSYDARPASQKVVNPAVTDETREFERIYVVHSIRGLREKDYPYTGRLA
jgi:hypothetical protein